MPSKSAHGKESEENPLEKSAEKSVKTEKRTEVFLRSFPMGSSVRSFPRALFDDNYRIKIR